MKHLKTQEQLNESAENLNPSDVSNSKNYIQELAVKYTSKILGYEKQTYPSNEWDWIEQAFIDGYNRCKKDMK
jgi:hypothetical protein